MHSQASITVISLLVLSVAFAKVPISSRKEMKTEIMRDLIQDLKDLQADLQITGTGNSFGKSLPISPVTTTYLIKITKYTQKSIYTFFLPYT